MVAERSGVRVRAQFQRSVRLDADIDRQDALAGYILQPSPKNALETVAKHVLETQQRAFTWTGPYGGGKSSLALAVAQLSGGSSAVRRAAREALQVDPDGAVGRVFGSRKPWAVLPVVGRRELVEDAIGSAIDEYAPSPGRKPIRNGKRDVIAELTRRAESPDAAGVLLVLDELGKLLEAAANAQADIYFFQELAEAASRCNGRLVIIGVLHQAFEQYATRLGREVRDEWAKVQGRFVDIPIVAGTDEVLELIGRALESEGKHTSTAKIAKNIAHVIQRRRPSSPSNLAAALDRCWPLHPVTAALLGPSSRRRFGQNERSVFGFLTSAEPLGFRDFLKAHADEKPGYYLPARYWDYLRANLETAILSSPDGHRWAVAAEAVERVEARFSEPHVSLVKTVGLIELFRNGSGLAAESAVLVECVEGLSADKIEAALEDLRRASILVYRKHIQAWGIFAGSDFDIDAAVAGARSRVSGDVVLNLQDVTSLPPITARRHYTDTGTLRWFDRAVVTAEQAPRYRPAGKSSRTGCFVLVLPGVDTSEQKALRLALDLSREAKETILYGVPRGHGNIVEQAAELAALEYVAKNKPELEGDAVARREIDARLRQIRSDFEALLRDAFLNARWYFSGERFDVNADTGLSPLASEVCARIFTDTPRVHSELINRDGLSSNAAKAQRTLLHRMLAYGSRPNLDYDGYPADAGLYYTVLSELSIHRKMGDSWAFCEKGVEQGVAKLWAETSALLHEIRGPVTLAQIYDRWTAPPFGLKQGILPILALAYLLAHRSRIAVYVEGIFVPELTDAGVDEWLQDPARISWKAVHIDTAAKKLLSALAQRLESVVSRSVTPDPLDSARALVSLAISLPPWTQRTAHLSERTRSIRTLLLRASDPVKVIFTDLPEMLGTREAGKLVDSIGEVVRELMVAYPAALRKVGDRLLKAIDHHGDMAALHERARIAQGISGDFKLDAFASRLQTFTGELSDIEGLVSLAVSKPPSSFTDHDFDHATLQLAKWAFEFRRVEALAAIQGRESSRRALAVVFGGGRTVSGTFDVAEADGDAVRTLADSMLDRLLAGKVTPDIFLAALVEAGSRVLDLQGREQSNG